MISFSPLIPPPGSRGREKGEFTNLQGVSAASSGRIVVADSNNQCIQVSAFTALPLTKNYNLLKK